MNWVLQDERNPFPQKSVLAMAFAIESALGQSLTTSVPIVRFCCHGTNQLLSYSQRVSFRTSLPQRTGGSGMPAHLRLFCK